MSFFIPVDHLLDRFNAANWQSGVIATIGLLALLLRHYRTASVLIVLAGSWLYLCSTPAFVGLMRQQLESPYPYAAADTYPVVDAIVVFGGDPMPNPKSDWQAEPDKISRNRLGFAYQLYRKKRAPIIVLSANKGGAVKMARILEVKGLASAALRVEDQADSTYENALYSTRLLKSEALKRVLLVTSPYHMPRALAVLQKQGIDVIPAPTMPRPKRVPNGNAWLPDRNTMLRSRLYLHEYLGRLAYWFRGWT